MDELESAGNGEKPAVFAPSASADAMARIGRTSSTGKRLYLIASKTFGGMFWQGDQQIERLVHYEPLIGQICFDVRGHAFTPAHPFLEGLCRHLPDLSFNRTSTLRSASSRRTLQVRASLIPPRTASATAQGQVAALERRDDLFKS